jgi:hypothetical protein
MSADQIAVITPALREVVDSEPGRCVTFEVSGDSEKWIQVLDEFVNTAYPHNDNPEDRLSKLGLQPPAATLRDWEANKYATFEFSRLDVQVVAKWIDAYFVGVIGCIAGEYDLDITFADLSATQGEYQDVTFEDP